MRKSNAVLMPILRKQAHAQLLYTVEEEFPIWTANRREAARRVMREDDLVTIEELVSDLIDKSCTQPATSIAMSLISKKPTKDDPLKPNAEGLLNKKYKDCMYCGKRHRGSKEKCFYLYPEL